MQAYISSLTNWILLVLLFSSSFSFSKPYTLEKVVAVVEDEMISLSSLRSYRRWLRSSLNQPHVLFEISPKKKLIKSNKALLQYLIDQKIVANSIPSGEKAPIQLPTKKVLVQSFLKQKNLSMKSLRSKLKKLGIPLSQFKQWLMQSFASNQWIQLDILSNIQISDQDINDYYFSKHKKYFFTKYKYEFNQWTTPLTEDGKNRIQKIYKTKNKSVNMDPVSKILTAGQMSGDLKNIITKISPGQFSKPKCFYDQCYVFELVHKSFHHSSPIQTEKLRSSILKKKIQRKLRAWMNEKRKSSTVHKYL